MKLNLINKAFLLKKTSLFGSLDLDLLLTVSDRLVLVTHRSEEKVFSLDQEANRMYLIVSGRILIHDRAGNELAQLEAGDFFGDEALFQELPRTYEAICETSTTLLALSRSDLLSIVAECPTVAIALLETYARGIVFRQR